MMKRARIRIGAAAAALCLLFGATSLWIARTAAAQTPTTPIKKVMGENFGGLQTILYGLISANYQAIPAQADVIHQHAMDLRTLIPDSAKDQREKFLALANNLGVHAQDLKSISETLMEHDKARKEPGSDYLREALASHYGGMVTTCVTCHNLFRPLPLK
jgi:cytochrome c556